MTQPQDKMRAEFEVFTNTSPAVPDWARRDVFDPETPEYPGEYRDMYVQMMWEAWQAACAQQSAQSQQDAAADGRWLVFNIGCIECGVSSNVVGRFGSEDEAKAIAAACEASLGWREGGQNSFEVFDLNAPKSSEYTTAIATQGASNV